MGYRGYVLAASAVETTISLQAAKLLSTLQSNE
jgi:hypothetical protein